MRNSTANLIQPLVADRAGLVLVFNPLFFRDHSLGFIRVIIGEIPGEPTFCFIKASF